MDLLPPELFVPIIQYLDIKDILSLRSSSRFLHEISSTKDIWRRLCFQESSFERHRTRQAGFQASLPFQAHPQVQQFRQRTQVALTAHQAWLDAQTADDEDGTTETDVVPPAAIPIDQERNRRLANWDPSYQDEQVDWLSEYAARHAPISADWFQPAKSPHVSSYGGSIIEARGLALLGIRHVVAPMDDASLAIWNCDQTDPRQVGRLIQKSKSGLLRTSSQSASPIISNAISVDSTRNRAYVAVQNHMQEIDLDTMQLCSSQEFGSKITTLSEYTEGVPLTIGTVPKVFLFDPRSRIHDKNDTSQVDRAPEYSPGTSASLVQAGPTAIQHAPSLDGNPALGDIVVAGRFPSLLVYDRRKFPEIKTTLYSGAQLCSMAALPYAYSSLDAELMLEGELPIEDAKRARSRPGYSIIACGEYNGRGALEIYGLSDEDGKKQHISTFKNRVSIARSKALSIANHGTKLVMSDAEGGIQWLERDGQAVVRKWNLNDAVTRSNEEGVGELEDGSGEAVLKVLPLSRSPSSKTYEDGVLAWTGERIGLLTFSPHPRFGADGWEEEVTDAVEAIKRREERIYGETMRRALERQADEIRLMSGLGLRG